MALLIGAPRCPKTDFPSSSTLKNLRPFQSHLSPYLPSSRLMPCLFYSSSRHPRLVTVSAAAISVEKTEKDRFPVTVTETKQSRSSVRLCIEVPPTSCKESYNKVLHEFSKQAKVPGFRPGKKIPENILINYVGLHNIQQAVIEEILKKTLPQAMISVEGRALKDSIRIVTKFAEMYDTFSPEDYFRYDVEVDVAPEIKWLTEAKYKNLKVIVQIDKTITAEIASEIEFKRRHKAQGSLRIVTDRGLQIGDLVVLDILAARSEGDLSVGEKIPSAERKDSWKIIKEGSTCFALHSLTLQSSTRQLKATLVGSNTNWCWHLKIKSLPAIGLSPVIQQLLFLRRSHLRTYDVEVDVAPEIKWLTEAKYKNLKVIVQIDKTITAEIASEIEFKRRHKAQGSLRIVTDRGLQIGDLVVLDILAARSEGDLSVGEKIPSAERKGFHLDTEESDNLLPGFLNSILGIRQGETKSFSLQFPESWEQVNLCGVQAQFTVECKELFYRDLPKLDDALAEKLFPGCSSLSQVRESILQRCREVEQTAIEQATDNAILEQLSKIVEADIPQSLFEEQGRQLYGARLLQLQAGRKVNEQQLSSLSSEKAVNEYLENQKENITSIIKQMLAVGEIFQFENLEYSTDELVKEVENSVEEFKRHNQEYDEAHVRQQVQDVLEGAKVLEWLRENSDIQYVFR